MSELTAEEKRLQEDHEKKASWHHWGPYLSARQWGNVREDYSADGEAWKYFTFNDSHMRAYRWGEDGIAGISDQHQFLCFAPAFWNGADPFLKERLFGLSGKEGNHGEDVKDYYFYLDNTPSHSYMKLLLRLANVKDLNDPFGRDFEDIFKIRQKEADEFYRKVCPFELSDPMRYIQRQAYSSLLWNKQFYHYVVEDWLNGDPAQPAPPSLRKKGRNSTWGHLYSEGIISMPDKWEYPWFAAWDLAFHTIPLAIIDPVFAKHQLIQLTREWHMHPNGQIPAYEWNFSDVNPPVQAWAALRVYRIDKRMNGQGDKLFLERVFHKLLMNFNWWINQEDSDGNNIFQGGFLGFDNIGMFNRTELAAGGRIEQADGTSWMAMYCLNMLAIALELAPDDPSYEDIASKFFVHFLYIAAAMNRIGPSEINLWDETDGFYYDILRLSDGQHFPLRVRSMVGILPLFAVETIDALTWEALPDFTNRVQWFIKHRPDLTKNIVCMEKSGCEGRALLSIVDRDKLKRVLQKVLDEGEFLSPYGVRSLSKAYDGKPYTFILDGQTYGIEYEPAESTSGLFGGNSNWRGPVWFPVNYLLIESLQKFHYYYGDDLKVEFPTGAAKFFNLWEVASQLSHRLINIFVPDGKGCRPMYRGLKKLHDDPYWKDLFCFFEYFNGNNGAGLGASHQAGWTALVAKLIQQQAEYKGFS